VPRSARWRVGLAIPSLLLSAPAWSHCDSLTGPVVQDALLSLDTNDVSPTLKWVNAGFEGEVRQAFDQAMAVRQLGNEARALADRHYFETVVRLHRAGEGEPYTGLKPAALTDAGAAAADAALKSGSPRELAKSISAAVEKGITERFAVTAESRKHADDSVEAGRDFVRAYVDYVHFVESVRRLTVEGAPHTHPRPAED
jgi:hypothetical protein